MTKALIPTKNKKKLTTPKRHKNFDYTTISRTDLGLSVNVTVIQLVWLNRLTQPTHYS